VPDEQVDKQVLLFMQQTDRWIDRYSIVPTGPVLVDSQQTAGLTSNLRRRGY
jgi:hypothetical protein